MGTATESAPPNDTLFKILVSGVVCGLLWRIWLKVQTFYYLHETRFVWAIIIIAVFTAVLLFLWIRNCWLEKHPLKTNDAIVLGHDVDTGLPAIITDEDRITHGEVIGTTKTGKTYFVLCRIIAHDIARKNGCFIVDGKSDQSFSKFINGKIKNEGRTDVAQLLLAEPEKSATYNPFFWGNPDQITERFFSAFTFDNPFYKALQFNSLRSVLIGLNTLKQIPTPALVHTHLSSYENLKSFVEELDSHPEIAAQVAANYADTKKYQEYNAGLISYLSQLCMGDVAKIFNTPTPSIRIEEVYAKRSFLYAQIPTMQFQTLGPAVGRLLLLELMQVISVAQVKGNIPDKILSVILDDFNDFMFEGFGSLLNKGRSGRVGVIFSHQSLGDLDRVSPHFRNIVLTNTNIKIVLKTPDPDSAETLSKLFGTKKTRKRTERVQSNGFTEKKTGDSSERETEEFLFHPNVLKSELPTGEGIVLKPTSRGTECVRVKFLDPNS